VYSENLPDDGQRNCPKHVEFYSKNKFEKLIHLVFFIERITFTSCSNMTGVLVCVWGGDLWWREWNKDRFCSKYSRTPLFRINWDEKPSGYAEDPDNWIFFSE